MSVSRCRRRAGNGSRGARAGAPGRSGSRSPFTVGSSALSSQSGHLPTSPPAPSAAGRRRARRRTTPRAVGHRQHVAEHRFELLAPPLAVAGAQALRDRDLGVGGRAGVDRLERAADSRSRSGVTTDVGDLGEQRPRRRCAGPRRPGRRRPRRRRRRRRSRRAGWRTCAQRASCSSSGRQHLADVDLAPLAAQAVEQVVLLVLQGPLAPPREVVGWSRRARCRAPVAASVACSGSSASSGSSLVRLLARPRRR